MQRLCTSREKLSMSAYERRDFKLTSPQVGLHVYQWRTTPPPPIKHIKVANGGWMGLSGSGNLPVPGRPLPVNSSGSNIVGPPATVTTTSLHRTPTVDVYCFNKTEHGLMSTPGELRRVIRCGLPLPPVRQGMYMYTSYGGRYIMSEEKTGPRKNPHQLSGTGSWVGRKGSSWQSTVIFLAIRFFFWGRGVWRHVCSRFVT